MIGRRCRRWPIAPVGAIRKGIDAVVQERILRDVVCPGRGRFPPPGALRYTVDSVLADYQPAGTAGTGRAPAVARQ